MFSRYCCAAYYVAIWPLTPAAHAQQNLRRAPSWALVDSNGHNARPAGLSRQSCSIIDMMQTTCPHCAAFADILAQVQQKYGDRVAILGSGHGSGGSADNAGHGESNICPATRLRYPILFDMGQMQYSYVLKPNVRLPHVYLIDPAGYHTRRFGATVSPRAISSKARLCLQRSTGWWERLRRNSTASLTGFLFPSRRFRLPRKRCMRCRTVPFAFQRRAHCARPLGRNFLRAAPAPSSRIALRLLSCSL